MTAQAHEVPRQIWVDRKVGAIRRALPPERRAAFDAALDDADLSEVRDVVAAWHGRAVGYLNGSDTAFEQARAAGYALPAAAVRLEDLVAGREGR